MKIQANGITFNCQVDGPEGAPWVVFSNSLATNFSMWDEQVAGLKSAFRILRYDQRGHGGTQATEPPYDFKILVDDVVALLDALSIERAHFVGISMGGVTGVGLVQRYRDRVARLVACDCPAAATPASAQQWAERIGLAKEKGMEALVDVTVGRWFPPEFVAANPPILDKVREMIRTTSVDGFAGCAGALSDFDFKSGLSAVSTPTLMIGGSKDAALPGVKFIHGGIAGSKLVELEGAGHLSNLEKPAEFTQAVLDFLK